ncbi:RNA polymerase Rpb3/Rpb11 dimerisation domain/RNA polymerase Rpb3/RpoA insert domain containing protein, putative [Angomonas deanei]|uniref:Plastid-encoded RNA polymerase subunit alpha n=1 Tax=Angomonas deanei TaxID=59799 RepID=A0A7G2CCJ4_9TRYP|nr:RNA polymerase Rpb3/Rpb11 dimerisation domain/RNA polymerase Rpb3/RpoA insert domain containing protein, putative [Angomonas deanei]
MNVDKARVEYHRVENTQTQSSPHTFSHAKGAAASTTKADVPAISNISITSAVAGLPRSHLKQPIGGEEEAGLDYPSTTQRVETLSFDIKGISAPVANLFRRLITTEVPTLAFDRILIFDNDGVVLDELLSHRIGLVPVAGPVHKLEYIDQQNPGSFSQLDPHRVLLFELEAEGAKDVPVTPVYSNKLVWKPLPGQEEWANPAVDDDKVFLVHPDIILTKLGPGQKLKLQAVAVKGLGIVHTKWSPVSSCYYEMKTSIELTDKITKESATKLQSICPKGVFSVDRNGAATVTAVEKCSLCRECLRKDAYPEFAEKIKIEKDKTSFRFYLESTGQLHAAQVFRQALQLFAERCTELSKLVQRTDVNDFTQNR